MNESEELIHIHIGGEEIIATPNHPFWVEGRGFTAAACLKPGDRVETTEGEILTVTRVEREVLDAPIPVYNLEVEDWHTCYVSEEKVLVHNMCSVDVGIEGGSTLENISDINKMHTPDQQALMELAKETRRNGGTTLEEANILLDWAKEYDVLAHGPEIHPDRPGAASNILHFHIGRTGHIPIHVMINF